MTENTFTNRVQTRVGDTTSAIVESPRRLVNASRGALGTTREEADQLLARGENLFDKLAERGAAIESEQINRLHRVWKGAADMSRKQLERVEHVAEQQMQFVLRTINIPSLDDISRLDKELERLNRKLDAQLKDKQLAAIPLENYEDLTAKEIIAQLEGLDETGLKAVEEFESAHGQRKTVLREVEHRLQAENA
ncbi:MAG: phasin family protein [Caldilineales bacterium]